MTNPVVKALVPAGREKKQSEIIEIERYLRLTRDDMKYYWSNISGILLMLLAILTAGCSHNEFPLPTIPPADEQFPSYQTPEYIQINPSFDAVNGYGFNHPADIYYGVDNFLYVADTDNNRIVMMDIGGTIQGYSQRIEHPEAISQNDSLQLLIVNRTNAVFRIDLYKHNHQISQAVIEKVFEQASQPTRQFTGISVHNGFEYYVTVADPQSLQKVSYIYDFRSDHFLKGPLPMEVNGSGLFATMLPTAIVSEREAYLDASSRLEDTEAFYFTQTGSIPDLQLQNYYKIQHVTTTVFEGDNILIPDLSLIGTDIYNFARYFNPEDIAIDRSGFLFVVDAGPDPAENTGTEYAPGFYRFSQTGKQLQAKLAFGSGPEQFNNPRGVAVTPAAETDQVVYIADTGNNRILRFKLSTDF